MDTELTNVNSVNTVTILDKLIRNGWKIAIVHVEGLTGISASKDETFYGTSENGLLYATFQLYRQMQAAGAIS